MSTQHLYPRPTQQSRSHTPLDDIHPSPMAALNEKVNEAVDFGGDYDYGDRQWFTDMPDMPQRPVRTPFFYLHLRIHVNPPGLLQPPQPVEDPYVPQQDVVEQNEIFQFALSAAPNVLYARYKQYGQVSLCSYSNPLGPSHLYHSSVS